MALGLEYKKGVLLTLVTIVLLILMVGTLITYVYLNIGYETVSSFGNVAAGNYRFASTLDPSLNSFLHSSLYAALNTLALYETHGNANSIAINNTADALVSLVANGMLYGSNEANVMGDATLAAYTNSIELQAKSEGIGLSITNSSLNAYQQNPYTINITYIALASINSTSGTFTYPIFASSGILLNNSPDLYSLENADNYKVIQTPLLPYAPVVGNVYAISGSNSSFQFIYGPVIVENGISSCSSIPSQFRNGNFILAVQNDIILGSCGFGGVVTYMQSSTAYSVPYLVYNSPSNVFNYIQNGTSLLLDGKGLSLLNLAEIQNALQSNHYYNSTFAPSYLHWAQSNLNSKDESGIFSFNIYNKEVPYFLPADQTYVSADPVYPNGIPSQFTLSAWISPNSAITGSIQEMIAGDDNTNKGDTLGLGINNGMLWFGEDVKSCNPIEANIENIIIPNSWYNVVGTYNSIGKSYLYINGVMVASGTVNTCTGAPNNFYIGYGDKKPNSNYFSGSISNVQAYSTNLNPSQAAEIYYKGINGNPVSNTLLGWWPLNGNANDYSGNGNNGIITDTQASNSIFNYIYGYTGDPIYDGSLYGNVTRVVDGAYNCANINQCSNSSLEHLYLGNTSLSSTQQTAINEAGSLGLGNAILPNVAYFNGNGAYIKVPSNVPTSQIFLTVSAWVYPLSNGGNRGIIGQGDLGSSNWQLKTFGNSYDFVIYGTKDNTFGTITPNEWAFLTAVYDSGSVVLYINGQQVATYSESATLNTAKPLYIGYTPNDAPSLYFYGNIADVQVYNTALTSANVLQLYMNDSVIGVNALDNWKLAGPYNNLVNQTSDSANALNYGISKNNGAMCDIESVISGACGVMYTQP